jgi:hypothetical protein
MKLREPECIVSHVILVTDAADISVVFISVSSSFNERFWNINFQYCPSHSGGGWGSDPFACKGAHN